MFLKPKQTFLNKPATLYKKFVGQIEASALLGNDETSTIKYQSDNYVKTKSFDYVELGNVNIQEVQDIKGLIAEQETFDIEYYDDMLQLHNDDIVVINNKAYMVIGTSKLIHRLPKPYVTYQATLQSLLALDSHFHNPPSSLIL